MSPHLTISMLKEDRRNISEISSLQDIFIGGGSVSSENLLAFRNLLPHTNISPIYGLTEVTGAAIAFSKKDLIFSQSKPSSCGRPIAGFWYKVRKYLFPFII